MASGITASDDLALVRSVLDPLNDAGAALRPALDARQMVLCVRRGTVSVALKTVPERAVSRLLAQGLIRREAPPSRALVITFAGTQSVLAIRADAEAASGLECVSDAITGETRILNRKESPLVWLARRKNAAGQPLISPLQFAAGERLRADFTFAGLTPRMTLNWTRFGEGEVSGIGHEGMATDVMIAARQRLHAALDALGPSYAGLALDLCCFLKGIGAVEAERGLAQRTAKHHLVVALDRLVRHYRMGAAGPERSQGIRVWVGP